MKSRKWVKNLAKRLRFHFVNRYGYESKIIDFKFLAQKIGQCPSKLKFKWSIDHILPLSSFQDNIASILRAWSVENLAWLPRKVNGAKSNYRLSIDEMSKLCETINPSAREYFSQFMIKYKNQQLSALS